MKRRLAGYALAAVASSGQALADTVPVVGPFDTQLLPFSFVGEGLIPLGRATGDVQAGDVDGYRFVKSRVTLSGSGSGTASLFKFEEGPIQHGDHLSISSSFDLTFNIRLEDIDPRNNYFGLPPVLTRNGTSTTTLHDATCIANIYADNYGCLPPTGATYFGNLNITVLLPDINGNGELDEMHIAPSASTVGAAGTPAEDDGVLLTSFLAGAVFNGFVADRSNDPPFSVPLTSTLTFQQNIVVGHVPLPGTLALFGIGLMGLKRSRAQARQPDNT